MGTGGDMMGGWHSRIESLQVLSTLDLDLDCDNFVDCDGMVELMRLDSHDHRTEITEKTD